MFSPAERHRRWALARELMDAEEVAALLLYGDGYLSGLGGHAADTLSVFPRDGAPVILADRPLCGGWAPVRAGLHPDGVADLLRELRLHRSAVGVVGIEPCPPVHDGPQLPYGFWTVVRERLPAAGFRSVWPGFLFLTSPLSAEEIDAVAAAARVGQAMTDALHASLRPGITEHELYAAATAVALAGGADASVRLASGPAPRNLGSATGTVVADGDLVLAELSCSVMGRESVRRVAMPVGTAGAPLDRAMALLRTAQRAGLRELRPGARLGAAGDAVAAVLGDATTGDPPVVGLNPRTLTAGCPHPVGHDYVLAAGMTFALQPSCDVGSGLVTAGMSVLITQDGAKPIENPL